MKFQCSFQILVWVCLNPGCRGEKKKKKCTREVRFMWVHRDGLQERIDDGSRNSPPKLEKIIISLNWTQPACYFFMLYADSDVELHFEEVRGMWSVHVMLHNKSATVFRLIIYIWGIFFSLFPAKHVKHFSVSLVKDLLLSFVLHGSELLSVNSALAETRHFKMAPWASGNVSVVSQSFSDVL